MQRLILNLGQHDEQEFLLQEGSLRIGRSRENEVHVRHKSLSRCHARLDLGDDGVVLHDLGSKNGTLVDGVPIDRRRLHGGETIRCGSVVFTFLAEQESQETAAMTLAGRPVAMDVTHLQMTELLSTGGQVGTTALNLRVRPDEPRSLTMFRILLKAGQLLSSPEGLERLPEKILDLAFEILDIDRAAILMIDADTGDLTERVTRVREGLSRDQRIYSEHVVREVVDGGTAALYTDARADPRLDEVSSVAEQSICAAMCAPLKPRDRVLGVLYVDNVTQPDRFGDEDLEFLTAFANQAALAIDNALLYARLEREAVKRNNLQRFFPPAAIDRLLEESEVPLGVRETEVTILFADISGFTALSSEMPPRRVVEMLNRYFPAMAEIVFRYQGTLEKYIGDALLAIWGAPYRHADDARRAIRAAVDMQRALVELNRQRGDLPEIRIHVGLNTGDVAVGNIGSEHYLQYATVGDATNIASRVCSVAAGGEILLTETTFRRLGDGWPTVKLPPIEVKGKDRPLELYRLSWHECKEGVR